MCHPVPECRTRADPHEGCKSLEQRGHPDEYEGVPLESVKRGLPAEGGEAAAQNVVQSVGKVEAVRLRDRVDVMGEGCRAWDFLSGENRYRLPRLQ